MTIWETSGSPGQQDWPPPLDAGNMGQERTLALELTGLGS